MAVVIVGTSNGDVRRRPSPVPNIMLRMVRMITGSLPFHGIALSLVADLVALRVFEKIRSTRGGGYPQSEGHGTRARRPAKFSPFGY